MAPTIPPGSPSQPTMDGVAAGDIRRFLKMAVQNNWSFPENCTAGDDPDRKIVEYRSRFYAPSDDSDTATGLLNGEGSQPSAPGAPNKRKKMTFRRASFFRSRLLPHSLSSKSNENATDAAIQIKRMTQHRKRECHLLQEMEWNNGLSIWTRRRDAWTGSVPISEAFSHTNSEDDSQASETVDESEIDDDVPVREAISPAQTSASIGLSDRLFKRRSSMARTTPVEDGLTITNHRTVGDGVPLYPSVAAPPRRHIPRHEHLPFALPVRNLIPDQLVVRPEIGPTAYSTLYKTLIRDGRQPLYPIPLKSVLSCCIKQWAESGEWPSLTLSYEAAQEREQQQEKQLQQQRSNRRKSALSQLSTTRLNSGPSVATGGSPFKSTSGTGGPPTPSALVATPSALVATPSALVTTPSAPVGTASDIASHSPAANPISSLDRFRTISSSPSTGPSTPSTTGDINSPRQDTSLAIGHASNNSNSNPNSVTSATPSPIIAGSGIQKMRENGKLATGNSNSTLALRYQADNGNGSGNADSGVDGLDGAPQQSRSTSLTLVHSNLKSMAGNLDSPSVEASTPTTIASSVAPSTYTHTMGSDNTSIIDDGSLSYMPGPIETTTFTLHPALAHGPPKKKNANKTVLFSITTNNDLSSSSKNKPPYAKIITSGNRHTSGGNSSNGKQRRHRNQLGSIIPGGPLSVHPLSPLGAQSSPLTPKAASVAAVEAAMEASSNGGSCLTSPVETNVDNLSLDASRMSL